ncbi:MAG: RdgB/HAM1 family non-canonical purine NTP pyrophosphatase [Clostridia bacterium]|nr:RdgB/HAM1 family non-canonical purine NTP pyrophosphatase [Clostridia bacterium]MDE7329301.1 RdgB/HAM1 family non-canonical purine NTP pyrophosphatase [Clostridia bacterium]
MKAVLASNNRHKLVEIKTMLEGVFEDILTLKDLNIQIEIEENGKTFEENALIKANTIAKMTNMPAIGDDSGLCVLALNGEPNIYSARYAGEPCDDKKNNQKLLDNIHALEKNGKVDRTAYFQSVIALCYPDGKFVTGSGKTYGKIIDEYRGTNGFGYDPLFLSDELDKTFGEATMEEKNTISHRSRALKDLLSKI